MNDFCWKENKAGAHLEPSKTPKMELFAKIVIGCEPLTIFAKKLHHRF